MPFVNGKYYMNPAYGRGVENARESKSVEDHDDDLASHWVTIEGRHVLIHEPIGPQEQSRQREWVVVPTFEKEQKLGDNYKAQRVHYSAVIMRPDGYVSNPRPQDGDHQVQLTEQLTNASKKSDLHICHPCIGDMPNSLTDTMSVTAGKPHSVVKRFAIDGNPVRIYDPASGKTYDYARSNAKYSSKGPSFALTYGNDPKK